MKEHSVQVDGLSLNAYEYGERGGQQLVLAHATGFHARCWSRVIAQLPSDWHIFALDARGHGLSENSEYVTWGRHAHDLIEVLDALDVRDAIGVGHSMGGHCVAHACGLRPDLFSRLVLIDPVVFVQSAYRNPEQAYRSVEDHPVARRKERFASWEAFRDRLKDRHPYTLWVPEVLDDYCRYGVIPAEDGNGVVLACPARVEAAVYMGNFDTDIYPVIGTIEQRVQVLRAPPKELETPEMDFAASPTWPELWREFPNGEDCYLPDLTHFIPMQDPGLVARVIAEG